MADTKQIVTLLIQDNRGRSMEAEFTEGLYMLGRGKDCDIVFPESDSTISRHHARLSISDKEFSLEDLESITGTMVNGKIIRSQKLENEDIIQIGGWSIRISIPNTSSATDRDFAITVLDRMPLDYQVKDLQKGLNELQQGTEKILKEINKRIVGQNNILRLIWATILARGHCLMIGVPGLAKTLMVNTFAEVLGIKFNRIQFTPDLMPTDIIGSNVLRETDEGRRLFEFVQGPVFSQLLLADEINRTPPKTQAALLEAMQERQVTVANKTYNLPNPFCVIASQNPIEQEGTYPLPEAQQDRFLICLLLDYPERDDEVDIFLRTTHGDTTDINEVLQFEAILRFQEIVDNVAVSREVANYVADMVRATRPGKNNPIPEITEMIDWGAGPRAGQAMIRTAKALAAMDGRLGIVIDDINQVALHALRHRIGFNFKARRSAEKPDDLIKRIIKYCARTYA